MRIGRSFGVWTFMGVCAAVAGCSAAPGEASERDDADLTRVGGLGGVCVAEPEATCDGARAIDGWVAVGETTCADRTIDGVTFHATASKAWLAQQRVEFGEAGAIDRADYPCFVSFLKSKIPSVSDSMAYGRTPFCVYEAPGTRVEWVPIRSAIGAGLGLRGFFRDVPSASGYGGDFCASSPDARVDALCRSTATVTWCREPLGVPHVIGASDPCMKCLPAADP